MKYLEAQVPRKGLAELFKLCLAREGVTPNGCWVIARLVEIVDIVIATGKIKFRRMDFIGLTGCMWVEGIDSNRYEEVE